jgi:hypothetical protein
VRAFLLLLGQEIPLKVAILQTQLFLILSPLLFAVRVGGLIVLEEVLLLSFVLLSEVKECEADLIVPIYDPSFFFCFLQLCDLLL